MKKMLVKKIDVLFWIELSFFVALLYGISACVYLNGDDFMYKNFSCSGIFRHAVEFYGLFNGRFWINIAVSALLWFDRYAFIVLLPWIVLAFIVLFAKNIQRIMSGNSNWEKEKELIRVGMVMFACLDVMCLRETVFWITGMMNYLFPATLFLFGYLLFQKSRAGEIKGVAVIGYYLVCILTSASVEQYALMFVGMMTLHLGYDLIKKKHVGTYEWIAYALSLVSLALLLLAPGNFVRVDHRGALISSSIDNVWTILHQTTFSQVALPYFSMFLMSFVLFSQQEKTRSNISAVATVGIVSCLSYVVGKALFDIALIATLCVFFAFFVLYKKLYIKEHIWFLAFVGIGSQIMLLISAVWGFRCMLSLYVVYMLIIGCLIYNAEKADRNLILVVGIVSAVHPVLAILLCATIALKPIVMSKLVIEASFPVIIRCAVAVAMISVLVGYAQNVSTYRENLESTYAQENGQVVIKELPNDTYSWYFVPYIEYHENNYRILHEIPEDVEIIYETLPE